jgi:PAS domain S-box-containing protein
MHGTSVQALIGSRVHDPHAPAERERIDSLSNTADRIGRVVFKAARVREDGSMCSSEMQIASVRGMNGEVLYRIVTAQDTTSRRRIEAERDQSRRLHDATPSQTPSSRPIDWIAAGMWRIACGESCRDSWEGLSDQEHERWRDYATGVVQEWVTSVGGSPWRNRRYA